jgi:hypothetical protein
MENEKQQDGIEERAAKHLRDNNLVWSVEGSLPRIVADFARTETATLSDERDRLKEALASLLEASRQYELFGLRYGIDFDTQASADTYKRLSNRLGDAQAKAKEPTDAQ